MDAREILAQIRADPELADEVRRGILTDQLLELPQVTTELAQRMDELAWRMDQLAGRMDQLAGRMEAFEDQLSRLTERLDRLTGVAVDMREDLLELRYRSHAGAFFAPLLRRARLVPADVLTDLVEDARDRGVLTDEERRGLLHADVVVEGRDRSTGDVLRLVVEVSGFLERSGVERAARRATLLSRVVGDEPVRAAVAGEGVEASVGTLASERDVAVVLDGRTA